MPSRRELERAGSRTSGTETRRKRRTRRYRDRVSSNMISRSPREMLTCNERAYRPADPPRPGFNHGDPRKHPRERTIPRPSLEPPPIHRWTDSPATSETNLKTNRPTGPTQVSRAYPGLSTQGQGRRGPRIEPRRDVCDLRPQLPAFGQTPDPG